MNTLTSRERGFTLVEALVAMVIISIGLLALGGFTLKILAMDETSRERTIAINVAEQILEEWTMQNTDTPPDATGTGTGSVTFSFTAGSGTSTCPSTDTYASSVTTTTNFTGTATVDSFNVTYDLTAKLVPAASNGTTGTVLAGAVQSDGYSSWMKCSYFRIVTVSWRPKTKNTTESVTLTNLTGI